MHHFSDASEAPVKYVSIIRLELTAAALSLQISMMLKEELDIHITSESFWTDSQVVLGYIYNESQRFKIFVADRVHFIRDHTDVQQCQYVSAHDNPAADESHELDSKNLSNCGLIDQLSFGLHKKLGCVISSQLNW